MLVAMMWKYSVQQITAYGIVFLFGISAPLPLGIQVKKRQFQLFPFFFFLYSVLCLFSTSEYSHEDAVDDKEFPEVRNGLAHGGHGYVTCRRLV